MRQAVLTSGGPKLNVSRDQGIFLFNLCEQLTIGILRAESDAPRTLLLRGLCILCFNSQHRFGEFLRWRLVDNQRSTSIHQG